MIEIDSTKCDRCGVCVARCPFGALSEGPGGIEVNPACKACRLCVKACPVSAISLEDAPETSVDLSAYNGVLVYVEHPEGRIAPVTLELIGTARELVREVDGPVYCLFIGADIARGAQKLCDYGVHRVFVYEDAALRFFRADSFSEIFVDCVGRCQPAAVLVGATNVGRSLAPRVAARLKTGLTADCTGLTLRSGNELVQTRPAFGGNIMARIVTRRHRPQFATVRYRVMPTAFPEDVGGIVEAIPVDPAWLDSRIELSNARAKKVEPGIENADCLIVAGRGVRAPRDIEILRRLAELLGGQLACTRPMAENGMMEATRQIGLSGRSVRPRLMITCGVSGAVQFAAGMKGAETVIAINQNPDAPIMQIANYAAVGDLYEIVPALIRCLEKRRSA